MGLLEQEGDYVAIKSTFGIGVTSKAMTLTQIAFPAPGLIELRFKYLPFGMSPGLPNPCSIGTIT